MLLTAEIKSAGYGSIEILHDIRLEIPEQSVVAIVGANGAGKTTILKTLAGLTDNNSRIEFKGEEIQDLSPFERVRNGLIFVPEDQALFKQLSVKHNLLVNIHNRHTATTVEKVLEAVPAIEDMNLLNRFVANLSGGERQISSIGRALAGKADLVMFDEPSHGLAPVLADEVYESIISLERETRSILLVEENLTRVMEYADLVYCFKAGETVFKGPPGEIDDVDEFAKMYLF